MTRLTQLLLITVMAIIAIMGTHIRPVQAAEMPYLMIMGEDGDLDAVPRDSRVFRRVLNELSETLNMDGFDVYDETAVTLDNYAQGRSRRSDAELIDIARTVTRPPIDVVVLFEIYASAERLDYTTKVRTRLSGRLLDAHSGRRMGNFEIASPRNFRAPVNCNRECILETVGNNARLLARDVADVLVQKLADEVDYGNADTGSDFDETGDYNRGNGKAVGARRTSNNGCRGRAQDVFLNFRNFTEQEMLDMEDVILAKFSCYIDHRPAATFGRTHEYVYKTRLHTGKLKRNLVRALEYLGMPGRVTYQGKEFTISKMNKRRNRYYNEGDKW